MHSEVADRLRRLLDLCRLVSSKRLSQNRTILRHLSTKLQKSTASATVEKQKV